MYLFVLTLGSRFLQHEGRRTKSYKCITLLRTCLFLISVNESCCRSKTTAVSCNLRSIMHITPSESKPVMVGTFSEAAVETELSTQGSFFFFVRRSFHFTKLSEKKSPSTIEMDEVILRLDFWNVIKWASLDRLLLHYWSHWLWAVLFLERLSDLAVLSLNRIQTFLWIVCNSLFSVLSAVLVW